MSTYVRYPALGGSIPTYANIAAFPATGTPGQLGIALDTGVIYEWIASAWTMVAGPGNVLGMGVFDSGTASADGAHIDLDKLVMQSATTLVPGLVNISSQTFAGTKQFNNAIYAHGGVDRSTAGTLAIGTSANSTTVNIGNSGATVNINGTVLYENVTQLQVTDPLITLNKGGGAGSASNSGIEIEENSLITGYCETSADRNSWILKAPNTAGIVTLTPGAAGITLNQSSHNPITLTAAGSTPNANGASLSTQALTLQPADGTNPGIISTTTQTMGGLKTLKDGAVVGTGSTVNGSYPLTIYSDGSNHNQAWVGPGTSGYQQWDWNLTASTLSLKNDGLLTYTMTMDNSGGTSFGNVLADVATVEVYGLPSKKALVLQNNATTPGDLLTAFASNGSTVLAKIDNAGNISGNNLSGTNTGDVSLGTANGLSLLGQALSLGTASGSTTGALTSTDWTTFNSKQNALTPGGISESTSSVLTITNGASSTVGPNVTIQVKQAGSGQSGYLSNTDWSTFNGKQAAGNYITALTGEVTASGPGSVAATIANSAVTNAKMANMATLTIKGNNTGGSAAPSDLTVAQVNTMLGTMTNPMTTLGDTIYENATPAPARLAGNTTTTKKYLTQTGTGSISAAPVWNALSAPTIQKFTSTGTTAGYVFTVTSANATVGATYTNNGNTYTVLATISSGTLLFCSGASAPTSSGTLTKSGGTGDSTITFSANQALATYTTPAGALYLKVRMVGGGGGGGGSGTASSGGNGTSGGNTYFGTSLLIANGGGSGGGGGVAGPGDGGTASLGAAVGVAFQGARGVGGGYTSNTTALSSGSPGAQSPFGGAGSSAYNTAGTAAIANTGSAGGGGGPGSFNSLYSGNAGGAGGYVDALITSPTATYYYAIGAKGTGGTAGTNGYAGGDGAAGVIIVEEYYQ